MRRSAATAALLFLVLASAPAGGADREETARETMKLNDLKLTVLYDNYSADEGLETAWGFACLVEGMEETILFDTGGEDDLLLRHMESLGADPRAVDRVVLSHYHRDHIGGLFGFLEKNPDVTVYVPYNFPPGFRAHVEERGAKVIVVDEPVRVTASALTTGVLGGGVPEQSLLLSTDKGVVVLTGCSHPGIARIVERAREVTGGEILLIAGGLHLLRHEDDAVDRITGRLRELGVRCVAPSHCSGDRARELFAAAYGDRFIDLGVGRVLTGADIPLP
ncbi:MAG: MBL fold metallo-hydrolase [Candidatus Eisenbacteria bacterium]|nr:MBL fold metallo-hydrolase [Candidatus Eisenbacteria bacterium]